MKIISRFVFLLVVTFNVSAQIIISEIHYNPSDEGAIMGDSLEFLEITNTGNIDEDISGYSFSDGIQYSFPQNSVIRANESIIIARDKATLESTKGLTVFGEYTGGLRNSGETLTFIALNLTTVTSFSYDDFSPWPITADGNGKSLEYIGEGDPNSPFSWIASIDDGGSPNLFIPRTASDQFSIRINEVLANIDNPEVEKIELYNFGDTLIDISNWYLSDDKKDIMKYQFPQNTSIEPMSYFVIDSDEFGSEFNLSSSGESIFIFEANENGLLGFSAGINFGPTFKGESFGYYSNSINELNALRLKDNTFGAANSVPAVGPLVITDIMYNPSTFLEQFIIIRNISDSTVSTNSPYIREEQGLKVNGLNQTFDTNTPILIESGQSIILTPTDPTDFVAIYNLPDSLKIFQTEGRLNTSSEEISLQYPIFRDEIIELDGTISFENTFITLDVVEYANTFPWPTRADGTGQYLRRLMNDSFGNDPSNWSVVNFPILGLNDDFPDHKFDLYPTLTENELTIVLENNQHTKFNIYDLTGQEVSSGSLKDDSTINLSLLRSGTYLIKINGYINRFIKQ